MTAQELIDLLRAQDPKAQVYLWTERYDLHADIIEGGGACISGVEEVTTLPGKKGVFLIEHDDRNYF